MLRAATEKEALWQATQQMQNPEVRPCSSDLSGCRCQWHGGSPWLSREWSVGEAQYTRRWIVLPLWRHNMTGQLNV